MLKTLAVFTTLITFGTTNKLEAGLINGGGPNSPEKGACNDWGGYDWKEIATFKSEKD